MVLCARSLAFGLLLTSVRRRPFLLIFNVSEYFRNKNVIKQQPTQTIVEKTWFYCDVS